MSINYDKIYLQDLANECFDKTSFAKALGYSYFNGKISAKISKLIQEYELLTEHFDANLKAKSRRKYDIIQKTCPVCSKLFETPSGGSEERVTCSYSCANVMFSDSKHTPESNLKRSVALTKDKVDYKLNCEFCKEDFLSSKKQRFCSQSCAAKSNWSQKDYKNKIISQINEKVANGTHKGWASRDKIKPSYPEEYTINILNDLNISYIREFKVNKWFIDFAFIKNKIALEIDGKQHDYPDRKKSDEEKDLYLVNDGWKVYRFRWRRPDDTLKQELMSFILEILK